MAFGLLGKKKTKIVLFSCNHKIMALFHFIFITLLLEAIEYCLLYERKETSFGLRQKYLHKTEEQTFLLISFCP